MGAGKDDVAKEDPAAEAPATPTDGDLAVPQPAGQAGAGSSVSPGLRGGADLRVHDPLRPVGFGSSSPAPGGARSTGLGGTGLRPRARTRQVRSDGGHDDHAVAVGAPGPVGGVGDLDSPDLPERRLLSTERVRGADQRPPCADPRGPELQDRLSVGAVLRVRVDLQLGAAMRRSAALLAMFLAATALVGGRDAPRHDQFRALMLWLAGCLGLFRWILSRR